MEEKIFLEEEDRDHRLAILSIIQGDSDDELLRSLLDDYHANDIAAVLEELSEEEAGLVILKVIHEDGEDLLSTLDSEEELDTVYNLFMENLFNDEE